MAVVSHVNCSTTPTITLGMVAKGVIHGVRDLMMRRFGIYAAMPKVVSVEKLNATSSKPDDARQGDDGNPGRPPCAVDDRHQR